MDLKIKYGKVAVVMGGDSAEREISLMSGGAVLKALLDQGVDAYSFDPSITPITELVTQGFSRALLMMHGEGGEDGVIQGALELLQIPYTGSGVMASGIAMDKYRTKLLWQALGVPVAKSQYVQRLGFSHDSFKLDTCISLPVVVKPANGGSTIGLSRVYEIDELASAIDLAFTLDNALLIESLIIGDEFSITVCDGIAYPVVQIVAPDGNYDYQNKYFTDDTKYICPAILDSELLAVIQKYALCGYAGVGARGVARLDFMLNEHNQIFFLELNTLPGMTGHSIVPIAYRAQNINFEQLCLKILDGATLDRLR